MQSWLLLTLGHKDALVDVRETAGEERAELDEVVYADALLSVVPHMLALQDCGVLRRYRPRRLVILPPVLLGKAVQFFFLFELCHVLFGHGAHRGELRANLVYLVPLQRVLLTNLLDFLVAEHPTCLSHFVFVAFSHSPPILPVVLLNFKRGAPRSLMCVDFGVVLFEAKALRSLVRLCLDELVAIGHSRLPLFRVLAAGKRTYTCHFTDLVVDFGNVRVLLQLLHRFQEGNLSHDNDFFKQQVYETLLNLRIVVLRVLLDECHRFDQIDRVLPPLLHLGSIRR